MFKFKTLDLVIMAMIAGIGFAIKPIISPILNLFNYFSFLPHGSLQSGFFLFWLVLTRILIPKNGVATITGFIQSLLTLTNGFVGNYGFLTLLIYTAPGVTIDLTYCITDFLTLKKSSKSKNFYFSFFKIISATISCSLACAISLLLVTFLVRKQMPDLFLLLGLIASLISGIFGGFIAYYLGEKLNKILKRY